ncbi:MAG: glycosyltransferase, partial [Ignavibacteriaceae bacterium]
FPNTKLIMVGDGPLEKTCIKLINELDLSTKVKLEGFQRYSRTYYQMFDIFLLSSHYEGMPYSLLEAMSMGIPAVGTNVIGIKDLIVHGETGYLVPEEDYNELANAVIRLIENPDKLFTFSNNSRNRTNLNFNFTEGIKYYQNFYSSLNFGAA